MNQKKQQSDFLLAFILGGVLGFIGGAFGMAIVLTALIPSL
jgi:hypothetical protein